tara:strand:- start:4347 stop:4814 length:468 start_codon:yes stop_codon:yes gene_type:complete
MAGFLSADQINKIKSLADTLHTTFAQTITVYKNAKKTLIASTPKWNSLYGRTNTGSNSSVEYTTISETFSARVYYKQMDKELMSSGGDAQAGSQNKVVLPDGSVAIVVKEAGYNYIREARRVEFDGRFFAITSDGKPSGLIDNQFFTFVLVPIDE